MAKCLILGGGGFIGSHLAERLLEEGHEVSILERQRSEKGNLEGFIHRVDLIEGDFLNEGLLRSAVEGTDYLFHYISTTNPATSLSDPAYDVQSNVVGSLKIFRLALELGVKKVIFPSSGGTIYGEPANIPVREDEPANSINPYAITKLAIERYLHMFHRLYGLDFLILRYSNPYGERQNPYSKQGVIPIILNRIKRDQRPVIFGDGSMVRDYIYIKDAIDATVDLMKTGAKNEIFNVGSGEGTSLNELLDTISRTLGKKIEPDYESCTREYVSRVVLDISKIRKTTGWEPKVSLDRGIKKTWQWILDMK